ncbi:hypothetical protein AB833_13925 [Chromatiales bacterium (ex Bugula neritina AB1)]|nr:hypothetical protein AB833_13925 [Chromatiales bacterium (ex Bugula neritina AB1)]
MPTAYKTVSHYHAVPARLLYCIALTETQKQLSDGSIRPWPWTLNIAGQGRYFDSRAEMQQAVTQAINLGVTNIDIGLMQINIQYHLHRSYSLNDLMRPEDNLNIAAEILYDEFRRCHGDWWCAVGAYHSPTPHRAQRYIDKVKRWFDRVF